MSKPTPPKARTKIVIIIISIIDLDPYGILITNYRRLIQFILLTIVNLGSILTLLKKNKERSHLCEFFTDLLRESRSD
ncbi:MAG: hypothetical protein Kow0091_23340 [Geminocystis sp.]